MTIGIFRCVWSGPFNSKWDRWLGHQGKGLLVCPSRDSCYAHLISFIDFIVKKKKKILHPNCFWDVFFIFIFIYIFMSSWVCRYGAGGSTIEANQIVRDFDAVLWLRNWYNINDNLAGQKVVITQYYDLLVYLEHMFGFFIFFGAKNKNKKNLKLH